MTALEHTRTGGSEALVDAVLGPHYPWCDPPECAKFGTEFHPNNRPLAHLSRRYDCDHGDGSQVVGIVAQLVRFVEDPRPRRYLVRLEVSEPDQRTVVYIEADQGAALGAALTQLATLPDNTCAADGPPEPPAALSGQASAASVGGAAEPSDPTPALPTAAVKENPR